MDVGHLLFNGISYYFTVPTILSALGNTGFLALYLGAGLVASVSSLWWHSSVKKNPRFSSLGASGTFRNPISHENSFLTSLSVIWVIRCIVWCPIVLRMFSSSSYLPHIRDHPLSGLVVYLRRICLGWIQRSHWKPKRYRHRWPRWRSFGWDRLLHPQDEVTHISNGSRGRI